MPVPPGLCNKSFVECVVDRTKEIERLLEENFDAEGPGLRAKARNVAHLLDDQTSGQIEFIGAIRNKLLHKSGYVFDGDEYDYLSTCDEVIKRLSPGLRAQQAPPPRRASTTNRASQSPPNSFHSSSSSAYTAPPATSSANVFPAVKALTKGAFIVLALGVLIYVATSVVPAMIGRLRFFETSNTGNRPQPQFTVKVEKILGGRTPNEKMYQFSIPARTWVETGIKVQLNQEVNIHHFVSNEQVTVSLGAMTDDRLQRAGTILPLYTASDCSVGRSIHPTVSYTCVELSQPESIKFYARNPVQVGVYIRPLEKVQQTVAPTQPVQDAQETPGSIPDQPGDKPETAPTADAPLLTPVPYDQSKPPAAPAQSPVPPKSPAVAPTERHRIIVAPNMTIVEPDERKANANKPPPEEPSDGIPRLKKRPPQ